MAFADTSGRLLAAIQRHMLEGTIDLGVTWSSLWTQAEVLGYLNHRIARFVGETGLLWTLTSTVSATSFHTLPAGMMVLRRVVRDGIVLIPLDSFQADNAYPGWSATTGTPFAYIEEPQDLGIIDFVPPPAASGTTNVWTIETPVAHTGTPGAIVIPGIFTPYVGYGVMADMLSKEGEANDPERAAYAESRFEEGIELAKLMTGGV